ncbi:transporter [Tolypocladium capitatum]|uniref:Transporter n=1 Tax=Tolypocladium capitatum TaxID=45235 RepID=A0A2K3Q838_9HYPO|nr:transporter [Tolypocladium capitatum]
MPAAGRLSPFATSSPPSPAPAPGPSPISVPGFPILPDGPRFDPPRSAASTSAAATSREADDIEMEPVAGHRRRKSSLMNPVGAHPAGPSARPGALGHRRGPSLTAPQDARTFGAGDDDDDEAARPGDSAKDGSGRNSFSDEDLHDDEETGLTNEDRSRRQKKRRRNTLLHNRIAREKNISDDERKEADKSVVRRLVINGVFILLWYLFSLCISLYNKWMFDEDRLNFAFPLFTTSMHMVVQFALSSLVLYLVPSMRPQQAHNSDAGRSRHEAEPNGSGMSNMFYLTRIGPCGAATGLDIGLGNTSLKFISLTFYTMCKSSSLAFVLLFAFVFRLETPTLRLVAIIATMTMGVVLMVFGEVEFKLGGFVLVISAAFFSGFRWGLTQILLLRNPATSNPFSSIFFLSPVMFITLLSIAIPVEGFGPLWGGLKVLSDEWGPVMTPLFLLFPGCIAFLMTASEFALLQRTSVVTLSIAGIFKEVVTISAASVVFQDKLTLINVVGLLTTMAAIVAYNYIKITKMRQEAQSDVRGRQAVSDPLSLSSNSGSGSDVDNDDGAEETAGLLHQSTDMGQALVSSDGDVQHNLLPSGSHAAEEHEESNVARGE